MLILSSFGELWGAKWRFYVLFFLLLGSMNGIVLTGDIFNLYVFFEIYSVSAYALVAFSRTRDALEASFKYLVIGTVGGLFLLLGISMLFAATKSLNFALLTGALKHLPHTTVNFIAATFLTAFFIKIGSFPTHFWLPDAHSSIHSPISAFLSGAMLKSAVYAFIRISFILFHDYSEVFFKAIIITGSLSIICGHLLALMQEDIKRLLAYSTVAHLGYIFLGLGCSSAIGVTAAIYHAINHAAVKTGLFLSAGVLIKHSGTRQISGLNGLFSKSPTASISFIVLAAAIVGIPPLNGFMSKWILTVATIEAGYVFPALAIAFGTVISACYYVKVILSITREGSNTVDSPSNQVHSVIAAALVILSILLGALPFIAPAWNAMCSAGTQASDIREYMRYFPNL